MINYLLIAVVVVLVYAQNILNKKYALLTQSYADADRVFNLTVALSALTVFIIMSYKGIQYNKETIFMSLLFSAGYLSAIMFLFLAIKEGPLSLSALIFSYSLLIPALFGAVFLNERLKALGYAGIVLLIISLYLINAKNKTEKSVSIKWIVFIAIAALGNGVCSSVQKYHQTLFPSMYRTEFMMFALVVVSVVFLIRFFAGGTKDTKTIVKSAGIYPLLAGLSNAAVNVIMLTLSSKLPAVIMFPLISGGGIVLTFITAVAIFKEKLHIKQYIGSIAGLIAVILLSI